MKDGNTVHNIPQMISDPGPTSETDYIELKAGRELLFEHDGKPQDLSRLPPGTYTASVKLRPAPVERVLARSSGRDALHRAASQRRLAIRRLCLE